MLALVLLCISVASADPLPRIVGGSDAEPGSHRHQVSLRGNGNHRCGGTLLNSQWVLCAAHCTDDPSVTYTVVINEYDLSVEDDGEMEVSVAQVINHEQYGQGLTIDNDISLLRLAQSVELTFEPLPLDSNTEQVVPCTITGWGLTVGGGASLPNILQQTSGTTYTTGGCRNAWGFLGSVQITTNHICFNDGTSGACNGDSGGPMVCDYQSGRVLCGVTSFGKAGCDHTAPSVYTRISKYTTWINSKMTQYSS